MTGIHVGNHGATARRSGDCDRCRPWRASAKAGRPWQASVRAGEDCTLSRKIRRLPGDAPIKLEVWLGLPEDVQVRHVLRNIVPDGRPSGRRHRRPH
jgi:hypothetical protein